MISNSSDLVSVIVPCYNNKAYVTDVVASIRAQTYSPIEIILVDDASTDGTADIVASKSDIARVELLSRNCGVSHARNHGFELAQGAFLQFLDFDDVLPETAIGLRIAALRDKNADIAYSSFQMFTDDARGARTLQTPVGRSLDSVSDRPELAMMLDRHPLCSATTMKRHVFTSMAKFAEDIEITADVKFFFDAAQRGARFAFVPEVGCHYRQQLKSLSLYNDRALYRDWAETVLKIEQDWVSSGQFTPQHRAALAYRLENIAMAQMSGDPEGCRATIKELARIGPITRMSRSRLQLLLFRMFGSDRVATAKRVYHGVRG